MAKRKRLSPIEKALAGVGKDVSGGAKRAAKKVVKPPPPGAREGAALGRALVKTAGEIEAGAKTADPKRIKRAVRRAPVLAKGTKGKVRVVTPKRAKKIAARRTAQEAARQLRAFEALGTLKKKKSLLEDILEEVPSVGEHYYNPPATRGTGGKDKDTKILGFNVEAELEGRGKLRDLAGVLKKQVESNSRYQTQGPAGEFTERIGKDLIDVAANAPASVYAVAAGAKEASAGRPKRLKEMGKQITEHSPIALALQGKIGKAAKEFEEHPGFGLLEVTGAGAAASRTAGAVARSGAAGTGAKRAASTKRAPRVAPGTDIKIPQRYSKGVVGKAAQRGGSVRVLGKQLGVGEKHKVKKARRLYREAGAARGRGDQTVAKELRAEAQEVNPFRVKPKELRRRYDRREGLAESRRRANRDQAVGRAQRAMPEHQDIGLLIAQKIVKPTRASLESYLDDLKRQHPGLRKAEKIANERTRKQIQKALDDDIDLAALAKAADRYAEVTQKLQRALVKEGVLPKQAERWAKLVPVAVREMGAKWNPDRARLELGGEKLTARQIERFLRSTGRDPKKVAFVSQHPAQSTAGAFYQAWQTPKGIVSDKRTGEATRRGTFQMDEETAGANVARMQGLVDATKEYGQFVKEFGYRKGQQIQKFKTRKEATDAARQMGASGAAYEWTPVAVRPTFGKGGEQARRLLDEADSDVTLGTVDALDAALRGEGSPRYVLVPSDVADQMRQHLRVIDPTAGGKALRLGTQQFKNVVLTTSPTWPTGNIIEAALRTFAVKGGPGSYALGKRTLAELRRIDPAMADELIYRLGSGHFGMQEMQAIHTTARQFKGTAFSGVARALGALRRAPGPKQLADVWGAYTRFIFEKNGLLEHQFKVAQLGRYAKDFVIPEKGLLDIHKAARQAAQGLRATNEQYAAAEWVRRAYGAYEGFSPSGRRFKAQYTPFAAWTMNATRFLLDVLPRDHPVATGLLASAQRATEQWQKDVGLDVAPGWLKGAIPAGDNWLRVGRYTPFSLAGDPLGTTAGMVMPQFNSILMNFRGLDWKGDPLGDYKKGSEVPDGDKMKAAVGSLFSAAVPTFGQATRAAKKEGSTLEKALQTLNPLVPVKRQPAELSRAFLRIGEIRRELEKLPSLDEMKESDPRYRQRKKLNAEQAKLQAVQFKLSKGEYGTKPSKPSAEAESPSGGSWMDKHRSGSGGAPVGAGSWMDQHR